MKKAGGAFPAHAGMIPARGVLDARDGRIPRTRGDDPLKVRDYPNEGQHSPHTRG